MTTSRDEYDFPDPTLFSHRIGIPNVREFEFSSDGNGEFAGCNLARELFKSWRIGFGSDFNDAQIASVGRFGLA